MRKSKRLVIFSEIEQRAFYEVPNFDDTDRDNYFNFSDEEKYLIMKCKFHHLKIFCALQIGYFKTVKIFNILDWENIKEEDIDYITKNYFNGCEINKRNITEYECYIQRKNIVQLYGYRLWATNLTKLLTDQSREIIKRDISVNFIGRELIKFLEKIKIVRPGYTTLQTIIGNSLTAERKRISSIIDKELDAAHKKEIKSLLSREEGISKLAALHQDAKNFGFKMMLKERQKHKTLEYFYSVSQSIIKKLGISQQNVDHYADLAIHYNSRDLSILGYNQSYLYILCYIFQKYQEINDNLVEAFRYNAKKTDAGIRARVKKKFQEEKADVEKKIGRLLLLYVNKKIEDKSLVVENY